MKYAEIIVHRHEIRERWGGWTAYTYEWKGSKNAPALIDGMYVRDMPKESSPPWPLEIVSTDYAWDKYVVVRKDANLPLGWYYKAKEKIAHKTAVTKHRLQRTAEIWGLRKQEW